MLVQANFFTIINRKQERGAVVIDVDDNASEEEIIKKAEKAAAEQSGCLSQDVKVTGLKQL